MSLPARHGCFGDQLRGKKLLTKVHRNRRELKIVAGRAAKQKQVKRTAKANENGSTDTASSVGTVSRSAEEPETSTSEQSKQQNPLFPDDTIGSLSEFGVQSGSDRPDEKAANIVEEISSGPSATTYAIWITFLLGAIGIFYGLVFAASGSLSEFLKDKVTFTRKDFVPYSERRRLEDNLEASRQERQGAERAGGQAPAEEAQPYGKSRTSQSLYDLLPAPPLKK